ncbi:cytochrome c3 family protein [Photobacterium lutimaris]|uniref:Cytochrome C n=1 Tax=Photobacterium lutimaris TaxID=388278 RepID=A0A2T3J3K0_9GAMM|nr:cytochrome c3 family protein [Photobacterium lutimaris]PSU35870.1 cytochrome C [Photobacterium lutimaris]
MKYVLLSILTLLVMSVAPELYASDEPDWTSLADEYTLKPHHKALKFECVMCHQGNDPEEYEPLETENCLSCHGSAKKVADRLQFMDKNHTNPHNSFHDGYSLDCYECHSEHEPSTNLCSDCHKTTSWMGKVP